MTRLINFADSNMTISQEKNAISALKYGAQEVVRWNPGMIDPAFFEMNKDILTQPRGAGYWLWKPYIIYREMLTMQDGDILVYSDSGIEFVDRLGHIIDRMKDDFFFFSNGWPHHEWCKLDVIDAICPNKFDHHPEKENYEQIQASLQFYRVNNTTKRFVKEWLLWCQMPGFIDDSKSKIQNYPTFAEHRHDQAILTCLALEWAIPYRNLWPDKIWQNQRHRWPHSDYPPILIHTRKRNNEW